MTLRSVVFDALALASLSMLHLENTMFLPALTINNWINLEWSENVFLASTDTRITNPTLGLEKIDFVV